MDNSFIELLKTVGNQIDHAELNAAIKADNFEGEFALSEDGLTSAKEQVSKLLTLESAINNPEVVERINKESYPKHMKTALSKVEEQLKPIMAKLGIETEGAEFVSDKIGDLEEKISTALASGDNKDVIEALNKELREARELPSKLEEDFNNKIKEREESYKTEKLRDKFILKATESEWAGAYSKPGLKKAILAQVWESINAKAHLLLSEDGEIKPMQKDMPDKELYDGNKVMTFKDMLKPEIDDYLKKSSPEKVNANPTSEKKETPVNAREANNLKELEAQKRMYAN